MELTASQNTTATAEVDTASLKARLRRSQRQQKIKAMLLVAPLFLFTLLVYLLPIGLMLVKSVDNPELQTAWPETSSAIEAWDGSGLPDDNLFALLNSEIRSSYHDKTLSNAAQRLNYEQSGMRSLVVRTGRRLKRRPVPATPAEAREQLIDVNARWADNVTWRTIKRASPAYTSHYLLSAVDHTVDQQGDIVAVKPDKAIYLDIFARTLWIAFMVTMICLMLGFPLAHLLANAPPKWANLLMIGVLLPFWTSLLVRTSAWVVLLQKNGVVNSLLMTLGVSDEPLVLLFNRPGVYIGLVHILLPFMVLSLYSVMKSIPTHYMRAALSLGANPVTAFIRVYLPQTLPGVAAGFLLCFIMSIGYYITPALIGSPQDQMISYFIAYYTNTVVNWGMASALGAVLLLACCLLFVLYARLSGENRVKMG